MASAPGEKLIIKLWDTVVDKGICGVFRVGQMKREGLAKAIVARNQIIMLAQAERDAENIRSGLLRTKVEGNDVILIPNSEKYEPVIDLPGMYAAYEQEIVMKHITGEINLAKTILKAEEELKDCKDEVLDDEVDLDWINRWKEYAISFSTEDLQLLWAKVLAGEIKNPGKFSIRTLEFIKTLTREEAIEIEGLIPFIFDCGMIYRGYLGEVRGLKRTINKWLSFDFLWRMQEYGLVSDIREERMETTIPWQMGEKCYIICNDKAILYKCRTESFTTTFIPVTKLGLQLAELSKCKANMDYIMNFAQRVKMSADEVYICDFHYTKDGINCFNMKKV
ncbi:DUF2806 domain-containing protein [Klebsiella variicola]|uniref:DUF2806 domain-containing protein n=1 Tax=Klebsiella variicola TaxID=244366 RepID=UPI001BD2DEC1|nr:DUF2806 domain-containing protein [Klebsiella variicola]